VPRATAPLIPSSYGVPTDASGGDRLPWSWAEERLVAARNYWICTTRPDGRPHAMPVWGLWLEGALWFSTGPTTQKARNLAANPEVIVHLESGDDVVVIEGGARAERDANALEPFVRGYDAKYGYRVDPADHDTPVFVVRPRLAYTWTEQDFPRTAVRWVFE
jgi:PPOX class probable F420-dependent enzyme